MKSVFNELIDMLETSLPLSRFAAAWCKSSQKQHHLFYEWAYCKPCLENLLWWDHLEVFWPGGLLRVMWCRFNDESQSNPACLAGFIPEVAGRNRWAPWVAQGRLVLLPELTPVPPGLDYAKLEGKSPRVIFPVGFWQLQHMEPCIKASLSAFPSSGLSPPLDQVQSMNAASLTHQRQRHWRAGWISPYEHQEPASVIAQHLSWKPNHCLEDTEMQVPWHDKGHWWLHYVMMVKERHPNYWEMILVYLSRRRWNAVWWYLQVLTGFSVQEITSIFRPPKSPSKQSKSLHRETKELLALREGVWEG